MILKYHIYIRNHEYPRWPPSPDIHPNYPRWGLKLQPYTTTPNNSTNTNENIVLFNKIIALSITKNKDQTPISKLVMLKNTKNDNVNINTEPEVLSDNEQNTIYNRRVEHATTATVLNNRFTTKCTLDFRPVKPNSAIN